MKKTLLAIVAGFAFSTAIAQSTTIQVQNAPATVYGGYTQAMLEAAFPVVNTGTQPIDIRVSRKVISAVTGSENNFCWGINCYPPFVSVSPDTETIMAGASNNSFKGDYTPNGMAGITTIRYSFFRATGATDSVHVTVRFDASAAIMGTRKDLNSNSISISAPWPNPANDLTKIEFNLPANSRNNKLRIFNAIGGLVKEVAITQKQGTAIISTTNLANGVYFYTLQVDGRSVETKKLIVRH
jgi:hypothetical protein